MTPILSIDCLLDSWLQDSGNEGSPRTISRGNSWEWQRDGLQFATVA